MCMYACVCVRVYLRVCSYVCICCYVYVYCVLMQFSSLESV